MIQFVENKHWNEIAHEPEATQWLSRIVVGSHTDTAFSDKHQFAVAEYLEVYAPADIKSAVVLADEASGLLEVSYKLEAPEMDIALFKTAIVSLDAFEAAQLDLDDIRYTAGRAVTVDNFADVASWDPETKLKEIQYSVDEELNEIYAQMRNLRD